MSIIQIDGNAPKVISPIVFAVIIVVILIPIILSIVDSIRTKKQKKSLNSTVVFDNQLVSVKGEAQREPWKDRDSFRIFKLYFCNKISLTIKNEGFSSIDTDVANEPLGFNLAVRGKLDHIKALVVEPANERLDLSIKEGMVLLNHLRLEPMESFQLVFLGYFKVDLEDLDYLAVDYSEELH